MRATERRRRGRASPLVIATALLALLLAPVAVPEPGPADVPVEPVVFAHYFPVYPVSLDNRDPAVDYYAVNYLSPDGEGGKHLAYGGWLRDRPLPRAPLSGDWRAADLATEVAQAADAGVDGFFVDVLHLSGGYWDRVVGLVGAVQASGRDFVVVPQLDMNSRAGAATQGELAAAIAQLAQSPAVYRLDGGQVVLSAFKAEAHPPSWWTELFAVLRAEHGIEVAFAPTLLDVGRYLGDFAPISWAVGGWGAHSPNKTVSLPDYAGRAHELGTRWVAPVNVQSQRPYAYRYWEAGNLAQLRASWTRAIDDGADMVLMVTWNDYSEGTTFAPSAAHGTAFLQVNAYYAEVFRAGAPPVIERDTLVVTHRTQPHDAVPTLEHGLMQLSSAATDPALDRVEVQAFLTAPATLTLTIGTATHTYDAPAGVSIHHAPLGPGTITATTTRDGTTTTTVTSPHPVTTTPHVQDLQYHATTSAH